MYLRIDEGFDTHRKTLALARVLAAPEAGMFMIRLWKWACRSSPDGNLTGTEPADIEEIVRWRGPPGAFYAAARGVGFIDDLGDRRELHDWNDWTGADVQELEADARRKWWARRHAANPRKCGGASGTPEPCPICRREGGQSSGGPSADSLRKSRVDQSSPDQTRSEKTGRREDPSSSGAAASPPAPAPPPLLIFPTVRGSKSGPQEWHYTESVEADLRECFPALDVRSEVRAALGWVRANEKKTAGGMKAFLTRWLTRAQNEGRGRALSTGSAVGARPSAARAREQNNHDAAANWLARKGAGDATG